MKSLILEYMGITIVLVLGLVYINHQINALITVPVRETPQTASTSLTVKDTGYNSVTDLLQTTDGINDYQNPNVRIQ